MPLCDECYMRLPWNIGDNIGDNIANKMANKMGLYNDLLKSNNRYFDKMSFMMEYNSQSSQLLKPYKFYAQFYFEKILCSLLDNWLREQSLLFCEDLGLSSISELQDSIDAVIPVPLYRARLIKRGFNQVSGFANILAKFLDVPVLLSIVKKVKNTKVQSRLGAFGRAGNLSGAFSVNKDKQAIKRVIVVDDVMTTGSTVNAVAKALKAAGVEWVAVFVLLRAGKKL